MHLLAFTLRSASRVLEVMCCNEVDAELWLGVLSQMVTEVLPHAGWQPAIGLGCAHTINEAAVDEAAIEARSHRAAHRLPSRPLYYTMRTNTRRSTPPTTVLLLRVVL